MNIATVVRVVQPGDKDKLYCYSVQINGLSLRDCYVPGNEAGSKWMADNYCTRVNEAIMETHGDRITVQVNEEVLKALRMLRQQWSETMAGDLCRLLWEQWKERL